MPASFGKEMTSNDNDMDLKLEHADGAGHEENDSVGGEEEDGGNNGKSKKTLYSRERTVSNSFRKSELSSIKLGGMNCTNGTPAYALLAGVAINKHANDSGGENTVKEVETLSIPMTHLPAVLGRKHARKKLNLIGLKEVKLLSRVYCSIFYRDAQGGRWGHYKAATPKGEGVDNKDAKRDGDGQENVEVCDEMVYIRDEKFFEKLDERGNEDALKANAGNVIRPSSMDPNEPLPKTGFFAIQCLGKYKIVVGGKVVDKGRQAMLTDGIPIQIASYYFYFLLPTTTPKLSKFKLLNPKDERVRSSENDEQNDTQSEKDKLKEEESLSHQPVHDTDNQEESIFKPPPAKKARKSEDSSTNYLEKVSTRKLLSLLSQAVESDDWDRNDQLVGSALALRAVRAAAKSKRIQKIATSGEGVSQREILDWVKESKTFNDYERMMLAKIERKSFLTSVGKAIVRAGYTRNETNPRARANRWDLPPEVLQEALAQKAEVENVKKTPVDNDDEVSDEQTEARQDESASEEEEAEDTVNEGRSRDGNDESDEGSGSERSETDGHDADDTNDDDSRSDGDESPNEEHDADSNESSGAEL